MQQKEGRLQAVRGRAEAGAGAVRLYGCRGVRLLPLGPGELSSSGNLNPLAPPQRPRELQLTLPAFLGENLDFSKGEKQQ